MKPKVRKILTYATWTGLVLALMVMLSFVNKEQQALRCNSFEVGITPETDCYFVTKEMVTDMLTGGKGPTAFVGHPVSDFNVGDLERQLETIPHVKNAEVFIDVNGDIKVDVEQRKPIIRIMKGDGSGFYIDAEGLKMPLSDSFTAHVPIATGYIYEKFEQRDTVYSYAGKELYQLARYIDSVPFWQSMIDQVEVTQKNELVLIPKVADHRIMLGNTERLAEKLNNLKIFYKKGLNILGWNKYKVINLKYTGQIVCEKY